MATSHAHPTISGGKFSLDIWLQKNKLSEYKNVFISHKMTTIDKISTSSPHYSRLLSDPKLISNPLLISKIAVTINNLQTAYDTVKNDVILKMETKLSELTKYDTNTHSDTLFNAKAYEIEKANDESQLNAIRSQISELFTNLNALLRQKEQSILKQFKQIQSEILSKYNKIIEKMQKNDNEIIIQREYLSTHINHYKHNISEQSMKYDCIFEIRQFVHKIGANIAKNDLKTRKSVSEKQNIIANIEFYINKNVKKYIIANIDNLVGFDESNTKVVNAHNKLLHKKRLSLSHLRKTKSTPMYDTVSNSNNESESMDMSVNINGLDLINMSPNLMRSLHWTHNFEFENEHCKTVNIELCKEISAKELANISILYQYHINEEDEKDNLAIHCTDNSLVNGEQMNQMNCLAMSACNEIELELSISTDRQMQILNDNVYTNTNDSTQTGSFPPNTPVPLGCGVLSNGFGIETSNNSDSKLSQWQKCKRSDIDWRQQDGKRSNRIFAIICPFQTHGQNIDCVWIKMENNRSNSTLTPKSSNEWNNHKSKCHSPLSRGSTLTPYNLANDKRLIVSEGEVVKLQSSIEYNFDEIIIEKNGVLTVDANSKGYLLLKVKNKLEIHSHGKLNVSGLGHKGGKRFIAGEGKGGGGGCAKGYSSCGGGGGYGTFGENGRGMSDNNYRENIDGIGGNIYGDAALSTIHFGSGGGGGYGSRGGNGGGIICISCKNKIVMHENSGIYANGNIGKYYYDGCGSGGSIFIKCKYLYSDNDCICFIQAIGGKHNIEEHQSGHGGNGGFGRVRIYSQNIKSVEKLKGKCFVVTPVPYIG